MIHFADETVPIVAIAGSGYQVVPNRDAIRQRVIRQNLQADRTEKAGRNYVAGKWKVFGRSGARERVPENYRLSGFVEGLREVAGSLQGCGHIAQIGFNPP